MIIPDASVTALFTFIRRSNFHGLIAEAYTQAFRAADFRAQTMLPRRRRPIDYTPRRLPPAGIQTMRAAHALDGSTTLQARLCIQQRFIRQAAPPR